MRPLAILEAVNPPDEMSGDVHAIEYQHSKDGQNYRHDFKPGVFMDAEPDGTVRLTQARGRGLTRNFDGQTFLVNPPKRGKKKMARRMPPRHRSGPKKGQFRKRARGKRRRNQPVQAARSDYSRPAYSRKVGARPRQTPPRRRYVEPRTPPRRRNPCNTGYARNAPRMTFRNITRTLMDGAMDAAMVLTGKAATRAIPLMANLPKEGNIGLAVQGATAVVVSMLAQQFLRPQQARMILAGGLTAPLETLIVSFNVPFLGPALQPVESDAQLSAYLGGYVTPAAPAPTNGQNMGGYVDDGMGDYVDSGAWAYA